LANQRRRQCLGSLWRPQYPKFFGLVLNILNIQTRTGICSACSFTQHTVFRPKTSPSCRRIGLHNTGNRTLIQNVNKARAEKNWNLLTYSRRIAQRGYHARDKKNLIFITIQKNYIFTCTIN
jgi:hypothetical protein